MTRRFQFSFRALLVATTIAGVGCAWIGNAVIVTRQRAALMPLFNDHDYCLRFVGTPGYRHAATIPWIRRIFGDYPVDILFYEPPADPGEVQLRRVRLLFPETEIWGWPSFPKGYEQLPDGMKHYPPDRPIMI